MASILGRDGSQGERRGAGKAVMTFWPRLLEIVLGIWLIASPTVFQSGGAPATIVSERLLGALIAALAAASLRRGWERLHWLMAPFVLWLTLVPYFTLPRPGPALAQSDITTGLVLLMMLILPTRATEPPLGWSDFRDRTEEEDYDGPRPHG